jgi:23S rRNA (guanosine2251-2'-O)-methyltransferase
LSRAARVLLVEDDQSLALGLEFNLRRQGYETAAFSDAESAGEAVAREHPFDLFILDRMLPGKDGLTFLAELRAAGHDAPVLLLTARDAHEDIIEGLDGVEDPRNLGACLRTADAAGIDAVVVPKAHSAKVTAAAIKTSTGAAETVPVLRAPNLARTLTWLKEAGVWVVGADAAADKSLYATKLEPPVAMVLGGEGRGLRRLTRDLCDELVSIPMAGVVASLNVSVAAGVVLFELRRQSPR